MMANPMINIGWRMKSWISEIINKDFGNVSFAKGLYNIISLYIRYVPKSAIREIKEKGGIRRPYKKEWI
jgi:hypothetical protein